MINERVRTILRNDQRTYVWLAITTLLMLFANGRWNIPLATWLMPVFAIRCLRTQPVVRGYLLIVVAYFATSSITWWGLQPLPLVAHLVMVAVMVLLGSLPFLADRLLAPRLPGFTATLVYPLALTAFEFSSKTLNPMGSWGALTYTQYGNLALLQLVSVTGLWGLPLLIGWFGSVVNWSWERSFRWREIRTGVECYAGVLMFVIVFGNGRLALSPEPAGTVRVASFTAVDFTANRAELERAEQTDRDVYRQKTKENHERYFEGTVREARAGAKIVLWPELAGIVEEEDESSLILRGQEMAREEGIYLAMPLVTSFREVDRPYENKLIVVDPTGNIVLEHLKYGGTVMEAGRAGDGVLRTTATPYGTLSGVICWDMDYPRVMRQAGRNGTDILLAPSRDWRAIDPLHTQMAVVRAIENGVALVRQVDNGLSIATDPYGRVLAQTDHFTASERVMVAQVPTSGVITAYSVIGDLFGWLSLVGFAAIVARAVMKWDANTGGEPRARSAATD